MFSFFGTFACLVLALLTSWAMAAIGAAVTAINQLKRKAGIPASRAFCDVESQGNQQTDAGTTSSTVATLTPSSQSVRFVVAEATSESASQCDSGVETTNQAGPTDCEKTHVAMPKTPILSGQVGLWMPSLTLDTEPLSALAEQNSGLWVSPYTPQSTPQNTANPVTAEGILLMPKATRPEQSVITTDVPQLEVGSVKGRAQPKYDLRFRRPSLF